MRFLSSHSLAVKNAKPRRACRYVCCAGLILLAGAICGPGLLAQEHGKSKVPVLDKITSSAMHQAFSGIVQSFDDKHNTLNVNSVEGGVTETFPLKKLGYAYAPDGTRRRVNELTPGTNVIVYYDLHADRRNVSRIEILAHESKKPAPPS